MEKAQTKVFWRAPSGRIHRQKNCSGGPGPQRMTRVLLTKELVSRYVQCRCCSLVKWS